MCFLSKQNAIPDDFVITTFFFTKWSNHVGILHINYIHHINYKLYHHINYNCSEYSYFKGNNTYQALSLKSKDMVMGIVNQMNILTTDHIVVYHDKRKKWDDHKIKILLPWLNWKQRKKWNDHEIEIRLPWLNWKHRGPRFGSLYPGLAHCLVKPSMEFWTAVVLVKSRNNWN